MTTPSPRLIVILGATGAVGTEVIRTLNNRPDTMVTALARRPLAESFGSNIRTEIVDPLDPKTYAASLKGQHAAVCTLGVGQPTKVSRDEFTRIDHDAVLTFARACKEAGMDHFLLLGSVASHPKSGSFYLASKGRLRESIAALGFRRFSAFQPSMLLTKTNRYNWVQGLMLATWPVISHLLIGPLKKYREFGSRTWAAPWPTGFLQKAREQKFCTGMIFLESETQVNHRFPLSRHPDDRRDPGFQPSNSWKV